MRSSSSFSSFGDSLPRSIPVFLKLRILLGGTVAFLGIIFFVFGSTMAFIFASSLGLFSDPGGPFVEGKAKLITIQPTNTTENHVTVYRYSYAYTVNNSVYDGFSYSPGENAWAEGDTITIEYNPTFLYTSHIKGMRNTPVPKWVLLLLLIFPAIGLILFVSSLKRSRKNLRLVENGLMAYAKVTGKEATNVKINNRTVYKIFFEYTATDGQVYKSFSRTHRTERVTDEEKERVLFNPDKPDEAVLVDVMPNAVRKFFEQQQY